ncbi:MAG: hypothetical protein ACYCOU_26935 [Sulfobacillus sp.]
MQREIVGCLLAAGLGLGLVTLSTRPTVAWVPAHWVRHLATHNVYGKNQITPGGYQLVVDGTVDYEYYQFVPDGYAVQK